MKYELKIAYTFGVSFIIIIINDCYVCALHNGDRIKRHRRTYFLFSVAKRDKNCSMKIEKQKKKQKES